MSQFDTDYSFGSRSRKSLADIAPLFGNNGDLDFNGENETNLFFINFQNNNFFSVLAVIITAVIAWFIIQNTAVRSTYQIPVFAPSNNVFVIVWIVFFVLIALIQQRAVNTSLSPVRNQLNLSFIILLILLLLWALLFFRQNNLNLSLVFGIITFIVTLWWTSLIWAADRSSGFVALLFLIWIGYLLVINWQTQQLTT